MVVPLASLGPWLSRRLRGTESRSFRKPFSQLVIGKGMDEHYCCAEQWRSSRWSSSLVPDEEGVQGGMDPTRRTLGPHDLAMLHLLHHTRTP